MFQLNYNTFNYKEIICLFNTKYFSNDINKIICFDLLMYRSIINAFIHTIWNDNNSHFPWEILNLVCTYYVPLNKENYKNHYFIHKVSHKSSAHIIHSIQDRYCHTKGNNNTFVDGTINQLIQLTYQQQQSDTIIKTKKKYFFRIKYNGEIQHELKIKIKPSFYELDVFDRYYDQPAKLNGYDVIAYHPKERNIYIQSHIQKSICKIAITFEFNFQFINQIKIYINGQCIKIPLNADNSDIDRFQLETYSHDKSDIIKLI